MKSSTEKALRSIPIDEHGKALRVIMPGVSATLDYLIGSLTAGINQRGGDEHKAIWEKTRKLLKEARSLY